MLSCGGQGFLCRDDVVAENLTNNAVGCLGVCSPGWRLVADPRNGGQWYCTNITTPICPGKFNTGGFTSNSPPLLRCFLCQNVPARTRTTVLSGSASVTAS